MPSLLKHKRKEVIPRYLVVEISLGAVTAAVWEVHNQSPQLLQLGTTEVVDVDDTDELLNQLDKSLSEALVEIEPEPDEVIFGLPDVWLSDNQIIPAKKQLLRHLCDKLELKAIGFVVTLEAVAHYLDIRLGRVSNVALIWAGPDKLMVSLVSHDQLLGTQEVHRSDRVGDDVVEGIVRFRNTQEEMPTSFFVYGTPDEPELVQQELFDYDWLARLPLTQIPKIEVISARQVVEAVVLTAGQEVITARHQQEAQSATSPAPAVVAPPPEEEIADGASFGFKVTHTTEKLTEDADELEGKITDEDDNLTDEVELTAMPQDEDDETDTDDDSPTRSFRPRFSLAKASLKTWLILASLLLVITSLVATGVGAYMIFGTTAKVTLFLEPQVVSRQMEFKIMQQGQEANLSNREIPGNISTNEVSAQVQSAATGTKLVGQRASGQVTLFNRTNSTKIFEAGTRLQSPSGASYTLDQAVTIASASAKENPDLSVTTVPATAEVRISASAIGAEFNLASETEFGVANYDKSSFLAKASSEIDGGTSQEVTVVSASDLAQLKSQLKTEMNRKIEAQLSAGGQGFTGAIPLSDGEEIEETASSQVGEEATTITLSGSAQIRSVTYQKSVLAQLLRQDTGLDTDMDTDSLEAEPLQVTDNQEFVRVVANVQVKTSPIIDQDTLTHQIASRYPSATREYFQANYPGLAQVRVEFTPHWLPERLQLFPKDTTRIQITTQLVEE